MWGERRKWMSYVMTSQIIIYRYGVSFCEHKSKIFIWIEVHTTQKAKIRQSSNINLIKRSTCLND